MSREEGLDPQVALTELVKSGLARDPVCLRVKGLFGLLVVCVVI